MSTVCSWRSGFIFGLILAVAGPFFNVSAQSKERREKAENGVSVPSPMWHRIPPPQDSSEAAETSPKTSIASAGFEFYRPSGSPFWRVNPAAAKKLNEGDILVSVTSGERELSKPGTETKTELQQLFLKGVGRVDVDWPTARKRIQRYSELKEIAPDHFVEVRHHADKRTLYLHGVAMDYHARMTLRLYEVVGEKESRLHFQVVRGSFRGMKGFIELQDLSAWPLRDGGRMASTTEKKHPPATLLSMMAFYEAEKLPLPSFLLRFGLEAVMKVVARKMRQQLEKKGLEQKEESRVESTEEINEENQDEF